MQVHMKSNLWTASDTSAPVTASSEGDNRLCQKVDLYVWTVNTCTMHRHKPAQALIHQEFMYNNTTN